MVQRIVVASPGRRRAGAALLGGAVLAAHGLLLWPGRVPLAPRPAPAGTLVVRQLSAAMAAAEQAAPPPVAVRRPAPAPSAVRRVVPQRPAASVTAAPTPPAPGDETDGSVPPWPTYPTKFAPASVSKYVLQRGAQSGSATLDWRPADGGAGYEARLEGDLAGQPALGWSSRGGVDSAGLAPERFVASRAGRGGQAANFRRDTGRISFSATAAEQPLPPGAQDRLSALLQLAAVVEADPAHFAPGARISLFVAGVRDAEVWHFSVLGHETLALPAGELRALRLLHQPARMYGARVEVWLDPARHHLPVRLLWGGPGAALELQLAP